MKKDGESISKIFLGLGVIALFFEIVDVIETIFYKNILWEDFSSFVQDASGFVTAFSIAAILLDIIRKKVHVPLWVVSIINVICVNGLYSNQRWNEIWKNLAAISKKILSEASPEKIFLFVILAAIMITLLTALCRDFIESRRQKNNLSNIPSKGLANGTSTADYSGQRKSVFRSAMMKLAVGWLIVAITYYILNWIDIIKLDLSKEVTFVLYFGGIIAIALMIVIEIGDQENLANTESAGKAVSRLSLIFTFAIVAVILCSILNRNKINWENKYPHFQNSVLDEFLNRMIDSSIVGSVVILLVIVLIVHCTIKVFLALALHNKGDKLRKKVSKSVRKIEKNLVKFVSSLFLNFTSLLLFIPDFFATIGVVLLGEKFFDNDNK